MNQTTSSPSNYPPLDSLHLNITKNCNLACTFCYNEATPAPQTQELSLKKIKQIIHDAARLGAQEIKLSGGEPLTRTDWKHIAQEINDNEMRINLATNATYITEDTATFLKALNDVVLSISIDGDEKTHDSLRGQPGAHSKTLKGLECLKKEGITFDINATMLQKNLSMAKYFSSLSRRFDSTVRLTLLHPNGRGEEMQNQVLSIDEILRLREFCHVMRKHGVDIYLNLPPLLQYFEDIILNRGSACGWANHFCGILANGDVTICGVASDEPRLVAGNINDQRLTEIWTQAELFQKTRSFNTNDIEGVCGQCPYNEYCGGACRLTAYRTEGSFLAPYHLCQLFYDNDLIPEEALVTA